MDRKEAAERILIPAERGGYLIVISALTLAEVHKLRVGPQLHPEDDEQILRYFRNPFFEVVPVDRSIGEQANLLCRVHGLYPHDAIHLARALRAGVMCCSRGMTASPGPACPA